MNLFSLFTSQTNSTNKGGKTMPHASGVTYPPLTASARSTPRHTSLYAKVIQGDKDLSTKEIRDWRNALATAQTPLDLDQGYIPLRRDLISLYEYLSVDPHLQHLMQLRTSAVLNTRFVLKDKHTQQIHTQLTHYFESEWFYEMMTDLLDAIFYGYTVLEFEDVSSTGVVYHLLPREHIVPQHSLFVPDLGTPDKWVDYSDATYVDSVLQIKHGKQCFGVLNQVVPSLIYRKNVMQSWAIFTHKFGMPMVVATTGEQDPSKLDHMSELLETMGENASALLPDGTNVHFVEASKSDPYKVYDQMIQHNTYDISKAILGGTMLSDSGSSRAQSEVHERNLENRLTPADRRKISFFINSKLLPLLRRRGIEIGEEIVFDWDVAEKLSTPDRWSIVEGIIKHYDVDPEYICQTFGVPILGTGGSVSENGL